LWRPPSSTLFPYTTLFRSLVLSVMRDARRIKAYSLADMKAEILIGIGILLSTAACGAEPVPCSSLAELACVKSTACKLVQPRGEAGSPYKGRTNANSCEVGFVQYKPSRESCEYN